MLENMILTLIAPDGVPICMGDVDSVEEAKEITEDFSKTIGSKYGYSVGAYINNKFQVIERCEAGEHDAQL